MKHEQIRNTHLQNLNSYRQTAEYAEYARSIGAEPPRGDLPSIFAKQWEIDEETYHEFLEMLPPLAHRGGSFFMSEFSFGDITTKFSKIGDRYFCEFARYPEQRKAPVSTPWGMSQHSREIAPGITRYDTASHGGYYVSPARVAKMPKPLRDFKPWAGANWYEEDCDWAVVALAFPHFFPEDALPVAEATLKAYKPELHQEMVKLSAGRGA